MNSLFGPEISIGEALLVTAICMVIVFFILSLISGILSMFKYIPAEIKPTKEVKKQVETPVIKSENRFDPSKITDESMIVAMLVASIEAAEENEGAYIKVRNIREI